MSFPRRWLAAIRQRSRWVAGIALQSWERHGWCSTGRQCYWFWRDRKGLAANLIAPLAGLLFVRWLASLTAGFGLVPALAAFPVASWLSHLCLISTGMAACEAGLRVHLSARVYGARFAAAPLRIVWANLINCRATLEALRLFVRARIERRSPAWRKTEHIYPDALPRLRPLLGDVMLALHSHKALGQRIGEYLVAAGKITAEELECALQSQSSYSMAAGD